MKNFKKHINTLIVSLLIVISFSCDGWLDLEPENKLVVQEFWQKKEDVSAVMAAMYDAFRETSNDIWIWGELRADMVEFTGSEFGNYKRIVNGEILPSNSSINWSKFYNAINLANTILVFAGDVLPLDETFDKRTEKAYEAEALFVRSKCYFDLVRVWKEVPLVLQASNVDTVTFSVVKKSEADIIQQIEKDLLLARETAFKDEYELIPEMFKGRANFYSINALLADVYLWSEQYQKCIETCDIIIQSGKYSLQNANNWFELYSPGNANESIFELQYNDDFDNEENPFNTNIIPVTGTNKVELKPMAKELYSQADIRQGSPDPRSKFQYTSLVPKTKRTTSERDVNMIYYRYADILLMKAEALAELEKYNEANELINQIVQRATLQPLIYESNKNAFRNAILEERAKEFACEGRRWFDILRVAKRNNFENKNIIIQMILEGADVKLKPVLRSKVLDTMSYYLPIPQKEIDTNPNLVQNPYYDR